MQHILYGRYTKMWMRKADRGCRWRSRLGCARRPAACATEELDSFRAAAPQPQSNSRCTPHIGAIWKDQQGIVLVLALIITVMLSAFALAFSTMVNTNIIGRSASAQMRTGFYAAEAGLNIGATEFTTLFAGTNVPTTGHGDFTARTTTVGTRTVSYQLSPIALTGACSDDENPNCYTALAAGEKFAGLKTIPSRYAMVATSQNNNGDKDANLGAQFEDHTVPLYQFFAIFDRDLELHPGNAMSFHGRLHTNGNMYLSAPASANGLTISDSATIPNMQLSAAGSIFHYRKDSSGCSANAVQVDALLDTNNDNLYDQLTLPGCSSVALLQSALDAFHGSILMGTNKVDMPTADVIQRGAQYWANADLRIVLNLNAARAIVNFNAYCPAATGARGDLTSPRLYPIEVWDAGGVNLIKTNLLLTFMCERRGTIFYNDVPTGLLSPPPNNAYSNNALNYTPPFGDLDASDTNNAPELTSASPVSVDNLVYRRVGVDTGGDGLIDRNGVGGVTNSDRNLDICPFYNPNPALRPAWLPDYCPWPALANPTATSWYYDTDYRRGGFYDRREKKWVYMLSVNLRELIEWNAAQAAASRLFSPTDTSNGGLVIFLSVQGPNSTTPPASNPVRYGVRVFDAADLDILGSTFNSAAPDPTGLTVVSDQAVYIEGNYNTVDKVPAAVIGDTINVLSQSWEVMNAAGALIANDRKTTTGVTSLNRGVFASDGSAGTGVTCGMPACQVFTFGINAALVGGMDDTSTATNAYNGGVENLLRFHENWGPYTFTLNYAGSLVSLGTPRYANGAWSDAVGNNIYQPPIRVWDYDPNFSDMKKIPPLPLLGTYVLQKAYTRFYRK